MPPEPPLLGRLPEQYFTRLLAASAAARDRPGPRLIDLADSDFVDSSGLGAILWARHRAQAVGGDLHVDNCCPPVERAFTLAGLTELLH